MLLAISPAALAWDGEDLQTGNSIQIDFPHRVKTDNVIQYYDTDTGIYHDAQVESMQRGEKGIEVEIYDYDTKRYKVLKLQIVN
jgi:hypothetical protein